MDQLKNLKPEHKLLLSILALGLVAGLYYFLVIMDLEEQTNTTKGRINQLTMEKNNFRDSKGSIETERLKEKYAQVLRQIEENKKVLPEEQRMAEFIHSLETDAEESGVVILSYEPGKPVSSDKFYDELPVDMKVRGTYVQLVRFLKLMAEPKKRLANVRDLQFSADARRRQMAQKVTPFGASVVKSETQVTASFRVVTFVYTVGK